jgi:hypothetical protein
MVYAKSRLVSSFVRWGLTVQHSLRVSELVDLHAHALASERALSSSVASRVAKLKEHDAKQREEWKRLVECSMKERWELEKRQEWELELDAQLADQRHQHQLEMDVLRMDMLRAQKAARVAQRDLTESLAQRDAESRQHACLLLKVLT